MKMLVGFVAVMIVLVALQVFAQAPAAAPDVTALQAQVAALQKQVAAAQKPPVLTPDEQVAQVRKALTTAKMSPFSQACKAEQGRLRISVVNGGLNLGCEI